MWRTEQQAKEAICPLMYDPENGTMYCMRRRCMLWRENVISPDGTPESLQLMGYCGLAGVPPR